MDRREVESTLAPVLLEARTRGLLGQGPVEAHIRHAWPLVGALPAEGDALDLGSGGGVPALVLAVAIPGLRWTLVEAQARRVAWLSEAVTGLGLANRVTVASGRAEELARGPMRETMDVVTARSFGPPAVVAECGAPFLHLGGRLWVSEPPAAVDRWPPAGLALVGLQSVAAADGWIGLELRAAVSDRHPRRVGIPAKRPLF